MTAIFNNQHITFPPDEWKVQSPYLYLQSVGSTGVDGSTYGAHVRWMLLRNLGDTHLPKGDYAGTTLNFNRPDDYVNLYRSRYTTRFPTIIDFSAAPNVVNDTLAFWIYNNTNTGTVVYVHFRDTARYATVRGSFNPATQSLAFMENYSPGLVEVEVKDKLFFAAEFDVARDATTMLRVEALTVESNVPLSPVFVSCRKQFHAGNWCGERVIPGEENGDDRDDNVSCCKGNNLMYDGGFEESYVNGTLRHATDYEVQGDSQPGVVFLTTNAAEVDDRWVGAPHSGDAFLAVNGSTEPDRAALRFEYDVPRNTDYCFSGWLSRLSDNREPITLEFRFTGWDGTVQSFFQEIPAGVNTWEQFQFTWNSGGANAVKIEIFTTSDLEDGNDFGLDDLSFCTGQAEDGTPSCCTGPNILSDGSFENSINTFQYETDYRFNAPSLPGAINVTGDASTLNRQWVGHPHSGKVFLAVDGSVDSELAVLGFAYDVRQYTTYCFSGWLASLWSGNNPITLEFRFTGWDGTVQSFYHTISGNAGEWEQFRFSWFSGAAFAVRVEIFTLSGEYVGNDFGIDDLWFCQGETEIQDCPARIISENIRSVRFDVNNGYPRRVELETYEDYIEGALWDELDKLALTDQDGTAFDRLEPAALSVDGEWQKFNDNALVKVANYQDRWTRAGGMRDGVQRYIALSDTDPLAIDTLAGDASQDGAVETSMLDMLRMVSLDFHVARMLGLGYLDPNISADTDEYIYLAAYDTQGALDDTNRARTVTHFYMGIPTSPLDHRLPDRPQLRPVSYGLTIDNGEPQSTLLTDAQGYTPDGLARYVNLFVEPEDDGAALGPFFDPSLEFCATEKTSCVFYGIEYRGQGEGAWRKPEIAHDAEYRDLDTPDQPETLPLPNNADPTKPILQHPERESGVHEYGSYGINWFSRVSPVGNVVATDATVIRKTNRLLPPSNLAVQLIHSESPLMLTTAAEQAMLAGIAGSDKTLVRVTFDYFHTHDMNYDFADKVQLVFRSNMPRNVVGAIKSVANDPSNNRQAILRTEPYIVNSQGTTITPTLAASLYGNFIGGVVSCQQKNYIIVNVAASSVPGEGPVFTVKKLMQGNASDPGSTGTFVTVQEYVAPELDPLSAAQVMFMAVENMAEITSWGTPNPLTKVITIGDGAWPLHTETYVQDGETITAKLRGIWSNATATHTPTGTVAGLYRIDFQTYQLPHHPQSSDADPVEWYKGVVRIPRASDPGGPRKVLEVIAVENLGAGLPLVLHAIDNTYDPGDPIITGAPVTTNYYPGYKVYLHADPAKNFTASTILPAAGEGNRKTWLGARSLDTTQPYYSAVGVPAPIVAMEFIEPLPPEQPNGSEYATRPDFYYKSSYTFRINFGHKPFAAAMYRANEEALLRALYNDATYDTVRAQLDALGEDDPYFSDRWKNLISFDYVYDDPGRPYYDPTGSNTNGAFRKFPRETGYAFPNPNKGGALNGSPPGSILTDLRDAINGAFTPLTELPMMYDYIKGSSYVPVPKPQHIRNAQGTLLAPTDPEFDMAPMAKKTGNGFEIQFTDFTLDGSGNNIFFYYGREIGNRGRLGDPGPIFGPIRLINSRPPDTPGVKKVYVQELNVLEEIGSAVKFEINAYPEVQKVERMNIFRTSNPTSALSVRTMDLVKTIDLADTGQLGSLNIQVADDFENAVVPYGDTLYYRIVALRKIKDPDGNEDWAPSQPSKLLLTTVIDTVNPDAPAISFTSNGISGSPAVISGVVLSWPTTAYNGTYHLDKMNSNGDWVTIYSIKTNNNVTVDLANTDLGTNTLPKEDPDSGSTIYHRFKVRVENASGLFSQQEKLLSI